MPEEKYCPSAPARPGATLIGMAGRDGKIQYIRSQLPVTAEFLESVKHQEDVGRKYRFAATCATSGCAQWHHDQCSLPESLSPLANEPDVISASTPHCSIRKHCRWFHQQGLKICSICQIVITDVHPETAATDRRIIKITPCGT